MRLARNQRVRSGAVPPLAEGWVARPETAPGLEQALVPGAAVALIPAHDTPPSEPCSSGKTQLAVQAARSLWKAGTVDVLVWISATSREAVLSGYLDAAAMLSTAGDDDAEEVALRLTGQLCQSTASWLVVLDGVRRPDDIDGLRPAGPAGRVLITAADVAAVPAGPRTLPVPPYSSREGVAFLARRLSADPDQRTGGIDLVSELDGDPEALGQAAAVVASAGISCWDYRRDWYLPQRAQLAASAGPELSPRMVTWMTAVIHAEQLLPGGGTWPMLLLAAAMDGATVPGMLFTTQAAVALAAAGGARRPGPAGCWAAVQALHRAGLVTVDETSRPPAVRVSRGVRALAQRAAEDGILQAAVRTAADALAESWPAGMERSWVAAACRASAREVRAAAGDALFVGGGCHRLLTLTGNSLEAAGLLDAAAGWWRDVAGDSERLLGVHRDTVSAEARLADALLIAGQDADAAAWADTAVSHGTALHGPGHREVTAARVTLGQALGQLGKAGDAAAVLFEAAAGSEHSLGFGDPLTLSVWDAYTAACLAAGTISDAIAVFQQKADALEARHSALDPACVAARSKLAAYCLAAGRTEDAIAGHQAVLARTVQMWGADHPQALLARSGLAAAYETAGKIRLAAEERERAAEDSHRILGGDHPETLARHADLARTYITAGQLDAGLSLFQDAISRCEQSLSARHPLTVALRQQLADATSDLAAR